MADEALLRTVRLALVVALSATACGSAGTPTGTGSGGQEPVAAGGATFRPHDSVVSTGAGCRAVVVAAGDINDVETADLTGRVAATQDPDQVLVLGDNQYESGSLEDYRTEYDRTVWGRLKPVTNPVPGNHEYRTRDADGYFTYFGEPPPHYAYDAGCGWRGYALNSEVDMGEQAAWLRADLRAHPGAPVLASWHRPRWSSGVKHGSDPEVQPLWDALAGRTAVVLNGHEHNYERFAPIGQVRQFVAGTGGTSAYAFGAPAPGSEVRLAHTPGVLRLDLQAQGAYAWTFLDTAGTALDQGTS